MSDNVDLNETVSEALQRTFDPHGEAFVICGRSRTGGLSAVVAVPRELTEPFTELLGDIIAALNAGKTDD